MDEFIDSIPKEVWWALPNFKFEKSIDLSHVFIDEEYLKRTTIPTKFLTDWFSNNKYVFLWNNNTEKLSLKVIKFSVSAHMNAWVLVTANNKMFDSASCLFLQKGTYPSREMIGNANMKASQRNDVYRALLPSFILAQEKAFANPEYKKYKDTLRTVAMGEIFFNFNKVKHEIEIIESKLKSGKTNIEDFNVNFKNLLRSVDSNLNKIHNF